MPGTRKLGRTTAHRNAMLRGLVTYLLENGSIETTLYRAKRSTQHDRENDYTRQEEHTGKPPCCSFLYNQKKTLLRSCSIR